jgi:tRNA(adenine34) deaminase
MLNRLKINLMAINNMRTHIHYLKKYIELGKEAMVNGNPPVGSVLVKNDTIIGIGKEAVRSSKDVTKHAEIEAIKSAVSNPKPLRDITLYTIHETCIMCFYVIRYHHIKTVVFGTKSKYVGGSSSEFKILETEIVPNWSSPPKIIGGVLHEECELLSKLYTNR